MEPAWGNSGKSKFGGESNNWKAVGFFPVSHRGKTIPTIIILGMCFLP